MADTLIHLLNKRLQLLQAEKAFRSCIDTVLVAAACPIQKDETVLDLGCGVGGAGLCVKMRVPDVHLTGIDLQADQITLAEKNAALNSFTHCVFAHADVQNYDRPKDGKNALFDHIICNPPYNDEGLHTRSPSPAKALAVGHAETSLTDWIDCAHRSLKPGGSFTIIHKADQADKIILALSGRFGALEIIPLWPKAGEPAKHVILRGLKDRKSPATLHPGLVLHEQGGEYTVAANAILREMKTL